MSTSTGVSASTGLDVSSILQAALGSTSTGIDVTTAVAAAVSAARSAENTWYTQQANVQSQSAALNLLVTQTVALDDDLVTLNDPMGSLAAQTCISSDASIVTATAGLGSTSGTHTIVVNSVATMASWASGTVASSSSTLGAGTFTLTNADGTTSNFSTDGSTLSSLAAQINAASLGVNASVVTDATGARLAIRSLDTGAASNFSITTSTSPSLSFTQATKGTDGSLVVDGITVDSASNIVSGALNGITLKLVNASPGQDVRISVDPDVSQSATAIQKFVTDYNTVIKNLNSQFTFDGTSEGVLATDSLVRTLQGTLLGALSYVSPNSSGPDNLSTLASIGINVQNDGTLSIDARTLEQTLTSNAGGVQNLFQGDALNGFAHTLDSQLFHYVAPADGSFTADLQNMTVQKHGLQNDIDNYETNYVLPLQTQLEADYSQAEILLQQLPKQLNQINEMLGINSSNN